MGGVVVSLFPGLIRIMHIIATGGSVFNQRSAGLLTMRLTDVPSAGGQRKHHQVEELIALCRMQERHMAFLKNSNPVPPIDFDLSNINSHIVFPSTSRPP